MNKNIRQNVGWWGGSLQGSGCYHLNPFTDLGITKSQTILKKKNGSITLLDFKSYYNKTIVIQIVWYLQIHIWIMEENKELKNKPSHLRSNDFLQEY